ncbi:MAG: hypothetical protein RIC55_07915 [Pirellulaceae bacterium]
MSDMGAPAPFFWILQNQEVEGLSAYRHPLVAGDCVVLFDNRESEPVVVFEDSSVKYVWKMILAEELRPLLEQLIQSGCQVIHVNAMPPYNGLQIAEFLEQSRGI